MPPICRAETRGERLQGIEPPRGLLDSFLNTMCDALARTWVRTRNQRLLASSEHPLERWLASLFTDDPTVTFASPAQLQALSSSLQAWMRNLRAAGDQHFRIAFQLEAPEIQPGDANQPAWTLHYLLQSRDDPSLIVQAEEVWRLRGNVLTQLGKRFEQPQEKLLAGLGYAARLFPPLLTSLQAKQPTGVELSTNEAYTFLRQAAPLGLAYVHVMRAPVSDIDAFGMAAQHFAGRLILNDGFDPASAEQALARGEGQAQEGYIDVEVVLGGFVKQLDGCRLPAEVAGSIAAGPARVTRLILDPGCEPDRSVQVLVAALLVVSSCSDAQNRDKKSSSVDGATVSVNVIGRSTTNGTQTTEDLDKKIEKVVTCLLYTSDAADDLLCVDLGGRRIIKKKKQ